MNNNDILIGLRDALDLNKSEMVEIFGFGGLTYTEEEILDFLKCNKEYRDETPENMVGKCDYNELESFLNGLIIFKRGVKETKPGEVSKPVLKIMDSRTVNNVMLKKVKIALELTSEDVLLIFEEVGAEMSKGELTTFFRKQGHKHYKKCNDKHANAFLKGLAIIIN